jgi:mono/diheme cytochrome c family protein
VSVPRWLLATLAALVLLSWVPLAVILHARATTSVRPRFHLVQDMDDQPYAKPQRGSSLFADGRAMRPPVEGTVARGDLRADDAFFRGRMGEAWVAAIPLEVDQALLERGRERYDVFCSPCHGLAGSGDGAVAKRAEALAEGTWTPPASLHAQVVRSQPDGQLFATVGNGLRAMPAYGAQVPVRDRWAIVAHVRALERAGGGP